jgi:nucleoside-diphosphate-sugar epimerase
MKYLVTGAAGFIGSHLTDKLIAAGHSVVAVDNLRSGYREQVNPAADFWELDIIYDGALWRLMQREVPDGVFHCAAIARTPWCIEDPVLASLTNAHGTACVLEAARQAKVKRIVLSSSNVVYASYTSYRATKEMTEMWGRVYHESYGMSVISLRYSNVYGPRQSENGPSPNVFAALRKSKNEKGYLEITGDGEQSRDFTHVVDIVRGQIAAMNSDYCGAVDLCTGTNWTLNQVAKMFDAPVKYLPEREGDIKHIVQSPARASEILGWQASIELPEGIRECL